VVYSAGYRPDGEPGVAVAVCPSRLLADAPWAEEFVEWWLWSVGWEQGQPVRAPAWPFPGGLLRQPRRLVDACGLMRNEWPYLQRAEAPKPTEE